MGRRRRNSDVIIVGAPNAHIVRKAIEEFRRRTTAGAATFLVKVKAHWKELANEEADVQAAWDKAIYSKDASVPTKWYDRTNRAVFTWQERRWKGGTVSNEDWKSTWNGEVRKTVRRGSTSQEVRKHWDRVTGAWKQISQQRRRVDVNYDPSMVTALRHGTWMDEERFKKTCIKEKKKKGGALLRHIADFMLRQDAGKFRLGRYLSDAKIPWKRRRRWRMAVAENILTASFLTKIGKIQSAVCWLCRIGREAWGESNDGLAAETHGHINSAGCEGMASSSGENRHTIGRPIVNPLMIN